MSPHLSTTDIYRYRSKAVTADEVRLLDSHLAECAECRRSFMDSESVDAAYGLVTRTLSSASKTAGTHIAHEKMAAYVDGTLNMMERNVVEAHVKTCADCESDVTELTRLREAIASDEKVVDEEAVEAAAAIPQASAQLFQRRAFRIGLEAIAVLCIIAGVAWFSTRQIKSLEAENEQLRKSLRESESALAGLEHRMNSLGQEEPGGPTADEAEITVKLNDGGRIVTMDGEGNLRGLESLAEEYGQAIRQVLKTGQAHLPPVIAQLRGNPETMMTGNTGEPGFRLLSPIGVVSQTTRPRFRWMELSDARDYEVSVSDVRGKVIERAKVTGTDWRPAAPLVRGQVYQWQVRAITKDGGEVKSPPSAQPDAKFGVLDQSKFDELERARKAYSGFHLVLGTMYAKAGLIDEAKREFRALVDANPESQISRRILSSLARR
jgi:hypothetical protein